jgi:hypothetical protein
LHLEYGTTADIRENGVFSFGAIMNYFYYRNNSIRLYAPQVNGMLNSGQELKNVDTILVGCETVMW